LCFCNLRYWLYEVRCFSTEAPRRVAGSAAATILTTGTRAPRDHGFAYVGRDFTLDESGAGRSGRKPLVLGGSGRHMASNGTGRNEVPSLVLEKDGILFRLRLAA